MAVATRSPVAAYAEQVIAGKVIVGQLVRQACQRHLHDLKVGAGRGLWFDDAAAQRAIRFFGFFKHSKGEWAGRTFELRPWQEFIVGMLFGWKREYGQCPGCEQWLTIGADGVVCGPCDLVTEQPETGHFRRFQTAYIEVARKNGKSTLAAAIGIILAFFDDEPGAEVYAAATKRDQAKIVWSEARRMVQRTAALRKRIRIFVANLSNDESASKFEPLGADADNLDGLNIHGAIIDEYHAHKTAELLGVIQTAKGARRQPLIFIITTAGYDKESPCGQERDYATRVMAGTVQDDSYFAYIAALDEDDDWTDEAVWIKANPNLGVSVKPAELAQQIEKAQHQPAQQNIVRRKRLNQWTQQEDRWLDIAVWDASAGTVDAEALRGRCCFGGLDLANTVDIAAFVLMFPPEEGGDEIALLPMFWIPEDNMVERARRDRVPYDAWVRDGLIKATPGNVIDHDAIRQDILALGERYDIQDAGYDRWGATQLSIQLQEDGLTVVGMGQGFASMSAPTKELLRLVLAGKLAHGGNAVLRWMADNMVVRTDPAGNLKPDKQKSREKIDGMVAAIMALDRLLRNENAQGISLYIPGEEEAAALGA